FDGIFGDFPGAEGRASLTMKKTTGDMDKLWLNFRAAARQFAISDNYYTSAEVSVQGHVWTVFGRSYDFDERQWFLSGYDGRSVYKTPSWQPQGTTDVGSPQEGSLFDWLARNKVQFNIFTEALGWPHEPTPGFTPVDIRIPGGPTQARIDYPDIERACYVAG